MSSAHKAALARGRAEGHDVRRYLEAIETHRPRRGRPRTRESVERRLAAVNSRLADAPPLRRLHLLQERADLEKELGRMSSSGEVQVLERAFVRVARAYGRRKGIGYDAWRAAGVSAAVLQQAGVIRDARNDATRRAPERSPAKSAASRATGSKSPASRATRSKAAARGATKSKLAAPRSRRTAGIPTARGRR
jgi:hypothetical protein